MIWLEIDTVRNEIDFLKDISDLILINEGFSGDIKYIFLKNSKRFLIRFNRLNQQDRAMPNLKKVDKLQFIVNYMTKALDSGVKCPKVYDYGKLDKHNVIYLITSFIEGEVANQALKEMDTNEQYEAGKELGSDIKRLHNIQYQVPNIEWKKSILEPFSKSILNYNKFKDQSDVKFNSIIESTLLTYINEYTFLLDDRYLNIIHNDIHNGNVIIKNKKYNGIIDFNEIKYGDILYEHKYLTFDDIVDFPAFCKGILDGYFDDKVPIEFWKLAYLYNAISLMTYLPIPKPESHTKEEQNDSIIFTEKIYKMNSEYKEPIPSWYRDVEIIKNQ